jgi:hypothetical protein
VLQRYKLRLGDGTVLAVDHEGLSIWQADRRAMVQPVGTPHWKPLKAFVAQERAAVRRAARLQPKPPSTPHEALPLVYPRVNSRPCEPKPPGQPNPGAQGGEGRADGLPLIPPPSRRRDGPDGSRRRRASASLQATVRRSLARGPSGAPPPVPQQSPPVAPAADEPASVASARAEPPPIVSPPVVPPLVRAPVEPPAVEPPAVEPPPGEVAVDLSPIEQPLLEQPPTEGPPIEPASIEREPPSVAQPVVAALAEELPGTSMGPSTAPLPADEDVEWMALPDPGGDEPHSGAISWQGPLAAAASGRVRVVRVAPPRAAPPEARPRPAPAPVSPLAPASDRLERRDPQAARQPLGTVAASAFGTLLALLKSMARALVTAWKRPAREAPPRPSITPHEPETSRAAGAERGVPLETRGPAGVSAPASTTKPSSIGRDDVYRPRRSAADGLPILQLDPDGSRIGWLGRPGRATDEDLPTLELEPQTGKDGENELPADVLEPLEDGGPRSARRRARR